MVEFVAKKPLLSPSNPLETPLAELNAAPVQNSELPDYRPYEIAWRNFAGAPLALKLDATAATPPAAPKASKYSPAPAEDQVFRGEAVAKRGQKDVEPNHLIGDVQKYLNTYGEDLEVDGKFGPKTEAALQRHFGTKVIDRALLDKIDAEKNIDYLHESKGFQKISVEDRGKIDAALVKRSGEERGDLALSYKAMINRPEFDQLAPDVKTAAIEAMGQSKHSGHEFSIDELIRDPGFSKLSPEAQKQAFRDVLAK